MPAIATSRRTRRHRLAQALGPLDQGHAVGLPFVEEPARERLAGVGEPVEIDVEERQPALVLGHQHEARRVDGRVDAEAGTEALRELRLAGAQVAEQGDDVTGLRRNRKG